MVMRIEARDTHFSGRAIRTTPNDEKLFPDKPVFPMPEDAPNNRLDSAMTISKNNPLTSRVTVNRYNSYTAGKNSRRLHPGEHKPSSLTG